MSREATDIKAPDGYLLGGERVVRKGGQVLFHRTRWQLPDGFAEQGEYVWVHTLEGDGIFDRIEAAPPGYHCFYQAQLDRATVHACARGAA